MMHSRNSTTENITVFAAACNVFVLQTDLVLHFDFGGEEKKRKEKKAIYPAGCFRP